MRRIDDMAGLNIHRFQVLPLPPIKDAKLARKVFCELLGVGLEEKGFDNVHTFLVDITPNAAVPVLFIARMVKE